MSTEERDRKVLEVTFRNHDHGWGWHIKGNPARQPGQMTESEMEVLRLAADKTPQTREVWRAKTYAYSAPFNYPNVKVELGRLGTGAEYNDMGVELDIFPYGFVEIEEDEPIVAVTVIGSGCSSQSHVVLEAEPLEWKYARTGVRMWQSNLWGMHVRHDAWKVVGERWNDAGLSCARFDIPESRKVIVGGGSSGADPHYCIRLIRVEVSEAP